MHALVLGLLALAAALARAALFPRGGAVHEVTQHTFAAQVRDIEKPTLVAFTAPWCGHCQRLAPEFARAAATLDGVVKFVNVDCENAASRALCAQYGVQGFPTLKLFPATKKRLPRDYTGARSAQALVDYAVDAVPLSAVRKLEPAELVAHVRAATKPVVVLFSSKSRSSAMYRAVALDHRRAASFVFVSRGTSADVREAARELGVDLARPPLLVAFSGGVHAYDGKMKYAEIAKWVGEVTRKGTGGAKKAAEAASGSPASASASTTPRTSTASTTSTASPASASTTPRSSSTPQSTPASSEERFGQAVRRIMERSRAGDFVGGDPGMLELAEQMRELINHEWSRELHERSELSKQESLRVITEPEHAVEAITAAEAHLREGFTHERALIERRLRTHEDERGRPLTPGAAAREHEKRAIVTRILATLARRAAERGEPLERMAEPADVHDEL